MCSSGLFWVWTMIVVLDCCLHRNAGYKTLSGSGPVSAYCLCSEQLLVKRKWSKRIIIGCRAHRNFRAANQNVAIKFRAKTWRVAAVASQAKILQQSKRLVDSEQHLQNEICHMFLFSWRYIYINGNQNETNYIIIWFTLKPSLIPPVDTIPHVVR